VRKHYQTSSSPGICTIHHSLLFSGVTNCWPGIFLYSSAKRPFVEKLWREDDERDEGDGGRESFRGRAKSLNVLVVMAMIWVTMAFAVRAVNIC